MKDEVVANVGEINVSVSPGDAEMLFRDRGKDEEAKKWVNKWREKIGLPPI